MSIYTRQSRRPASAVRGQICPKFFPLRVKRPPPPARKPPRSKIFAPGGLIRPRLAHILAPRADFPRTLTPLAASSAAARLRPARSVAANDGRASHRGSSSTSSRDSTAPTQTPANPPPATHGALARREHAAHTWRTRGTCNRPAETPAPSVFPISSWQQKKAQAPCIRIRLRLKGSGAEYSRPDQPATSCRIFCTSRAARRFSSCRRRTKAFYRKGKPPVHLSVSS